MGSFNFKWEHPAQEVYVTGTFDNWSKSVKLDKKGDLHEKTVDLPESQEKILYKFVADGNWDHNHTAPTDTDHEGNVNNVLYPSDIRPSASTAAMSSVAPGASTTQMAGEQPLTKDLPVAEGAHEDMPGAFPETPAPLANDSSKAFGVNPIPASEGAGNPINLAPGDKVPDSSTFSNSTIQSNIRDDPSLEESAKDSEQTFGVAPLPATEGAGNPISLAPGEKVPEPSTFTNNTIDNNVRLDKESYESSTGAPTLPALSPGLEREAAGAPIFGLGPAAGNNMIPESSLPMGDKAVSDMSNTGPAMSSAAPGSTTAALAGQQPIEPRGVPNVVGNSQEEAQAEPEASANPEAVVEKTAVENELKEKVPEEPSTSESGLLGKSENNKAGIAGAIAGGIAAAGTAAAGGAYALRQKATESAGKDPVEALPKGVQDSINNMQNKGTTAPPVQPSSAERPLDTASIPQQQRLGEGISVPAEQGMSSATQDVPSEVVTSQKEARVDPEASANPEAVHEKSAMEKELLSEVKPSQATGEPAPTAAAVPVSIPAHGSTNEVPEEVLSSQKEAHVDPEASANPEAVHEKSAMEKELLSEVKPSQETGEPAPTAAAVPVANSAHGSTNAVPEEVLSSQKQAHIDPEASANPEAVAEKSAMEKELMSEVKPTEAAGEPAPTASAALAETAPAATTASASGAPQLADPVADVSPISMTNNNPGAEDVAARAMGAPVVAASTDAEPTVATTTGPTATEPITTEQPVSGSKELNAPAGEPATTSQQAGLAAPATPAKMMDSRDVSPMSKVPTKNHTEESSSGPTVTTGVASSSAPAESKPTDESTSSQPVGSRPSMTNSTPSKRGSFMDRMKGTPESARSDGSASESTKKRRSLFGRIKDKLKA